MDLLERVKRVEPDLAPCASLAFGVSALLFVLQARVGLAPQEEGYLWYGVDALARGEWPMRDFRSYDPGRYAWSALLSPLFGGGIVGLRGACALFGALGITAGLLVVRRAVPSRAWLAPAALLLALWAFPYWRPFEWGTSLVLAYAALKLVERPNARRSFAFGVVAGLAAFFGRNHGLYAVAAFVLTQIVVIAADVPGARSAIVRRGAAWIGGIVVGYLPMIALVVAVPGYARAFVDSVLFFVGRSGMNIAYPATWPWTIGAQQLQGAELLAASALSAFFILYVVGYASLGLVALRGQLGGVARSPAIAAAFCVGLPYVHHVAERSDVHHVAESIHPLLVGTIALAGAVTTRRTLALGVTLGLLLVASVLAIGTEQPLGRRLLAKNTPRAFTPLELGGATLDVDGVVAARLEAVRRHVRANVPDGHTLLLSTKLLPLYPDLRRRSPVWDIYPSWTADDAAQARMLRELAEVRWVFLQDVAVGGDEERRLSATYPRVWDALLEQFERLPTPDLPESFVFLRRR